MASSSQIEQLRARIAQIEAGTSAPGFGAIGEQVEVCASSNVSPLHCGGPIACSPLEESIELKKTSGKERPKDASAAYQRILRIVATREQSTLKVREKLLRSEFAAEVAQEAIEKAVRVGVIDDLRYCETLVSSALRSGRGLEDIRREAELLSISLDQLDSYQLYLEEGVEGQKARARQFLESHPVRSKNKRDGAFRKLVSRGFSASIASAVAGEMYPYRH